MGKLQRWASLQLETVGPEAGDAVLYAGSALFAGLTAELSTLGLYRAWGWFALWTYLFAAAASALVARRHARSASGPGAPADTGPGTPVPRAQWGSARVWIFLVVLMGAALMPLSVEVVQRGNAPAADASAHVQPEVVVIDQAAVRLADGEDPYRASVRRGHLVGAVPGEPSFESFFPYLPLMAVFGLPSSTHQPVRLTDTRIFFSVVTLLVVGLALALCRAPSDRKIRALQFLTVLPTAALPLATGGDDMPVVALLLLGMVLAQRRRPGTSGLVLGVVSAMKFTAWPLAALALFAARDRQGRRAPWRMLAGMLVVVAPVVAPFALGNPFTFVDNVILYPLGLVGVASPAASALPGHLLVTAFPFLHRVLPLAVAAAGGTVLLRRLVRRPPATAATAVRLAGWAMLVAIVFAPATRVGYLLYPADFFVWTWMLRGAERLEAESQPEEAPVLEAVAG